MQRDPVCGRPLTSEQAHKVLEYDGNLYFLCCPLCQAEFESSPVHYLRHGPGTWEQRKKKWTSLLSTESLPGSGRQTPG